MREPSLAGVWASNAVALEVLLAAFSRYSENQRGFAGGAAGGISLIAGKAPDELAADCVGRTLAKYIRSGTLSLTTLFTAAWYAVFTFCDAVVLTTLLDERCWDLRGLSKYC